MTLDPDTVGIAAGRLASILDVQQATLVRTAFSTIVRESEDLACGVFDRAGRMLGQSHSGTPGHINAMATGIKYVVEAYPPETLRPGDVLVTNDPWMTAGQINDLTVATPVFRGERMIGLFASTCHAPDIGGRLLSAEASDVYEEGLRLPIIKLARDGEMNEDLLALIRANVRTPRETVGDLYAQAAANDVGARSLIRCLDDLQLEDLEAVGAEIRRRSETAMRAAIEQLPDGRYEAVGYSDGHGESVELRLAAIIAGDEITLDFAGSSKQSEHGINVVLNYTHAYASFALKAAVAPGVPHNDGSFTPVHVTAPEGSILNCREPAPVASRHVVGHVVPGVVLAALAPVLDRRSAGSADALWISVWSPYNLTLFQCGGAGAWSGRDGRNASGFPSAVASVPTEVLELAAPLVQRERSLRTDSGGAGRWRGGLGQTSIMTLRADQHQWRVSALADRTTVPAPGADGGHDGALGEVSVDGEPLPTKRLTSLRRDAHVRLDLPGGGGVGDPRERDPQAVLADVVDGYITNEAAKALYGVTIRRLRDSRVLLHEDFEIQEEA
jgi:N-methylhydantoinase B